MQPETQSTSSEDFFVKRQMLQIVGQNIRSYDSQNNLVCFARKKALKLKEDIVFYLDEQKSSVLFNVKARSVIDIAATYDIFSPSGEVIASMKRKGLASTFVQDQWLILGPNGDQWGLVQEESSTLGVLRRYVDFVSLFIPQTYDVFWGAVLVGTIKQNKNPFTMRLSVHYEPSAQALGKTLKLAIPNLLAVLEGRQ